MIDIGDQIEERDVTRAKELLFDALDQVFAGLIAVMKQRDVVAFNLLAISADCRCLAENLGGDIPLEFAVEELQRLAETAEGVRDGSVFRLSCAVLVGKFLEEDPPNYVAWPIHTPDGVFEVKVSRPTGKDEHRLLCERTEERDRLLGVLSEIRDWYDNRANTIDIELENILSSSVYLRSSDGDDEQGGDCNG